MKARLLKTAILTLFFLLSVFAVAHAQDAANDAPSEAPSVLSAIAHDFTKLVNHVTGNDANDANDHRAGRHSPPLPRPRPRLAAERASAPVASNEEWSEFVPSPGASKKNVPVQIND
jgi:hypothetical protein